MKKYLLIIILAIIGAMPSYAAAPQDITYGELADRIAATSTPVVVDCYATWCGPCRIFAPVFDQVAEDTGSRAQFYRVDIDASPEILKLGVRAVPTVLVFYVAKGELKVETMEGASDKKSFQTFINEALKLHDGTRIRRD